MAHCRGRCPEKYPLPGEHSDGSLISILPISDLAEMESKINEKWSPGVVCPPIEIEAGSGTRKNCWAFFSPAVRSRL